MFIKIKFSALIFGIYLIWIIPILSQGLKVPSYSSLDYKERPPRPPKHTRSNHHHYNNNNNNNNNSYRISAPKPKNPSNRVPSYLQDINTYKTPNYDVYIHPEQFQASSSDAIRIVDPPKYFQEQKKYFQKSPLLQYDDDINYSKDRPTKKSQKPSALALHQIPKEYLHERDPVQDEFYYKGPEYLPYPSIKPQQQKYVSNSKPPPNVQRSKPKPVEKSKPSPTYTGIQTPNSDSIRNQIQSFKDKQRSEFEDEDDEHPVRPVISHNRRPTPQRRKPKPKEQTQGQTLGYDVFKEAEHDYNKFKDTFVETNNKPKPHSIESDAKENNSGKKESFVPYQMLASVRHTNRLSHQPRAPSTNPRATSRLKTQQSHTVYSEQGFEDVEYDHGDEERHAQHKQKRQKRDIIAINSTKPPGNDDDSIELIKSKNIEELPIAINLMDSNGKKLSGQELLKYISRLVKERKSLSNKRSNFKNDNDNDSSSQSSTKLNSILLKPEELEILLKQTNVAIEPNEEHNTKFPFEKLDPNVIPFKSAINYAEKLKNFNESPYEKNEEDYDCDENEEPDFKQNSKKRKLKNLGGKLECLKTKFFGKDPLGNQFFKEPINVPDAQQLHAERPSNLDHVYNDVMKTINEQLERSKTSESIDYPTLDGAETIETKTITRLKENPRGRGRSIKSHSYIPTSRKIRDKQNVQQTDENYQITPTPTIPSQYNFDTTYQVFDITQFLPKVYMIRHDGRIYSMKMEPTTAQSSPEKISKSLNKKEIEQKKRKYEPQIRQRQRKITTTPLEIERSSTLTDLKPPDIQRFTHENAVRKTNNNNGPYRIQLIQQ